MSASTPAWTAPGSVVQLQSGGALMSVAGSQTTTDGVAYLPVMWLDDSSEMNRDCVPLSCLCEAKRSTSAGFPAKRVPDTRLVR